MHIDSVFLEALLARKEGTRLDFKETHYANTPAGNAELAKDLSAMANALARGAASAHILIGVREKADGTGELVGVPYGSHFDDATLHQKVRNILNRAPDFSYESLDVNGLSVGVFEIRAGGRPIYAVRDNPPLKRNCAVVRDGSSTDVASPDQILEWGREDDPETRALRVLELQKARAKVTPKAIIYPKGRKLLSSGDLLMLSVTVENHGEVDFTVSRARSEWRPTDLLIQKLAGAGQDAIAKTAALRWNVEVEAGQFVPVGDAIELYGKLKCSAFAEALKDRGLPTLRFEAEWFAAHFTIDCEATTGNTTTVEATRLWPPDASED
jgi:hypothetical protein